MSFLLYLNEEISKILNYKKYENLSDFCFKFFLNTDDWLIFKKEFEEKFFEWLTSFEFDDENQTLSICYNYCILCFDNLGNCNPRQLCKKYYCNKNF